MKKIFYDQKWLAFEAPEKSKYVASSQYGQGEWYFKDMEEAYEKAYAEAKANALEVGNAHMVLKLNFGDDWMREVTFKGIVVDWPGEAVIKDGKYILSI